MENNNSCCCAPGRKTKRKDCAICGRPLVYFSGEKQLECAICHKMKPANAACEAGHFVCDDCHSGGGAGVLAFLQASAEKDPIALLMQVMGREDVHLHGPGKAFSNFIIGLEPFETLKAGATYLAERGVIPSASVWMPFGKPVNGSMKPAGLEYFRRTKEMLGELYVKFGLEPAGCCGLNVCVERAIWRQASGAKRCC